MPKDTKDFWLVAAQKVGVPASAMAALIWILALGGARVLGMLEESTDRISAAVERQSASVERLVSQMQDLSLRQDMAIENQSLMLQHLNAIRSPNADSR